MTGNKHNKTGFQKGQTLLIIIMLLATALTVVLSISFKSTSETRLTKLEEESQKTLAAVEAAIEASIKEKADVSFGSGSLSEFTDYMGGTSLSTSIEKEFVTPLIQKDGQYTFYLVSYEPAQKTLGTDYWQGDLDIYFKSGEGCPALELTFIKTDGSLIRHLLDPCDQIDDVGGETATTDSRGPYVFSDKTEFGYKTASSFTIEEGDQNKLLIVRAIADSTKVGFKGSVDLKPQGTKIESRATSTATGITKKATLFQSYPQIPAEFFVTSF